jgi:hypothetical protein
MINLDKLEQLKKVMESTKVDSDTIGYYCPDLPKIKISDFTPYESSKHASRVVVRLTTSYYFDKNGLYERRSLKFLKRKCRNFNFVKEDASCMGAKDLITGIINLSECEDGIYEIITCNESRDWETGVIDYYEYQLIPFNE